MENNGAMNTGVVSDGENISPDWPYSSDDPRRPTEGGSELQRSEYLSRLQIYSDERLESIHREGALQEEELWMDFTTIFLEAAFSCLS
jgi:hypothetical protein